MKLSEYSKLHSVTYRTAWNRFKAGKIKDSYLDESGHVVIPDNSNDEESSKSEWLDL